MSELRLFLLGSPRVELDGTPVVIGRRKAQALLYYLCVERSQVGRDKLADMLWPSSSQTSGRTNLRHALSVLTTRLGSQFFIANRNSIALDSEANVLTDVEQFRLLSAQSGDQGSGREAGELESLGKAALLYTDHFLAGFSTPDAVEFEAWATLQVESLDRELAGVLARLVSLRVESGEFRQAQESARRWISLDALHEPAYRVLMEIHERQGDRAGALRVYEECRQILADELGVDPDPDTRELHLHLLQDEHTSRPVKTPADPSVPFRVADPATSLFQHAPADHPMVGRSAEWRNMLDLWNKAMSRPRWISISGDAGIGKTRIAQELAAHVVHEGSAALWANCFDVGSQLAYSPVVQWLRTAPHRASLGQMDRVLLTELARLMPELRDEVPDLEVAEPLGSEWERRTLWNALGRAILFGNRPTLLVLDDLQWCDTETINWLVYLLHSEPRSALLVVSTERSEETPQDHPWSAQAPHLERHGTLSRIRLEPLATEARRDLASGILGKTIADDDAGAVFQETGGNPLFIIEMAKAGLLPTTTTAVQGEHERADQAHDLPTRIQAAINSRFIRLSAHTRQLTEEASCFLRAFSQAEIERSSHLEAGLLEAALEEGWSCGILVEEQPTRYQFSHDLIRRVVYSAMALPRRRLIHARIAEAQVEVYGESAGEMSLEIAHQYELAGRLDQAALHYRHAAETCMALFLYAEAKAHIKHGLELLNRVPESDLLMNAQAENLLLLAFVTHLDEDGPRSADLAPLYSKARDLAEKTGDHVQLCRALRGLAVECIHRSDWQGYRRYINHFQSAVETAPLPEFMSECHHMLGAYCWGIGAWTQALSHFRTSLNLAAPPSSSKTNDR